MLTTLVLVALALLLVRRSTARLERGVETAGHVGSDAWMQRAEELRGAAEGLRDAVAARDRR